MNYLTAHNIQHFAQSINKDIILHPTSIGYIQSLVTPYAKVLDTAINVESIKAWIPQAVGTLIPVGIVNTTLANLSKLKGGITEGPEFIELAKGTVIDTLISKIINQDVFTDVIFFTDDNVILPWDIKTAIFFHEPVMIAFGVLKGEPTLPTEVVIQGRSFTYEASDELVAGLLLYSLMSGNKYDVNMFGIPFSTDYFLNPQGNRFTKFCSNRRKPEYSVKIGGVTYCFTTTDFMQGLATGALWFNDDHHKYWTDLITYENLPEGEPLVF